MKLGHQDYLDDAFKVLRKAHRERGPIVVPDFYRCIICSPPDNERKMGVPADRMRRIRYTGVVSNIMDCVCESCAAANAKDLAKAARIVCVGCREVVAMVEPFKEKNGFVWKPGGFYHVMECPRCAKAKALEGSPIVEKIVFYESEGIPYA